LITATETLTNKTLTTPVINVGSDATGDMYYRDSNGDLERLAPGTSGHYLKTVGSGNPPQWSELIIDTYSSVKTSDFTASLSYIYPIKGTNVTVTLPEITSSNQGKDITFINLNNNVSSTDKYLLMPAEKQKIVESSMLKDYVKFTNSYGLKKLKSVYFTDDSLNYTITNRGSGYNSTSNVPVVQITGGNGSNAYVSLSVITTTSAPIASLTVTDSGSTSYQNSYPPTVSISGSGAGFEGEAIISGGSLTGILVINPGQGYSNTSSVSIDGTSATGVGGAPNVSITLVSAGGLQITSQSGGSNYTSDPTISVTGGSDGSNFSITATRNKGYWYAM